MKIKLLLAVVALAASTCTPAHADAHIQLMNSDGSRYLQDRQTIMVENTDGEVMELCPGCHNWWTNVLRGTVTVYDFNGRTLATRYFHVFKGNRGVIELVVD